MLTSQPRIEIPGSPPVDKGRRRRKQLKKLLDNNLHMRSPKDSTNPALTGGVVDNPAVMIAVVAAEAKVASVVEVTVIEVTVHPAEVLPVSVVVTLMEGVPLAIVAKGLIRTVNMVVLITVTTVITEPIAQ